MYLFFFDDEFRVWGNLFDAGGNVQDLLARLGTYGKLKWCPDIRATDIRVSARRPANFNYTASRVTQ